MLGRHFISEKVRRQQSRSFWVFSDRTTSSCTTGQGGDMCVELGPENNREKIGKKAKKLQAAYNSRLLLFPLPFVALNVTR